MEHLEKLLYNAYEGCATAMPMSPKVIHVHIIIKWVKSKWDQIYRGRFDSNLLVHSLFVWSSYHFSRLFESIQIMVLM